MWGTTHILTLNRILNISTKSLFNNSLIKMNPEKWPTICDIRVHIKKVTAIPIKVWTGPEASRSLRLPDFMKFDTHEDGKIVSPPENIPGIHSC